MIIELQPGVPDEQLADIESRAQSLGYKTTEVRTQRGRYLIAVGSAEFDIRVIGHAPGVRDVFRVPETAKLVSRKWKVGGSTIEVGDGVAVAEGALTIIAGPCSLENEQQVARVVEHLASAGLRLMRGGAFKPRSSPYAFPGLGLEGLKMCHALAAPRGIKVVSEVITPADVAAMYDYVDVYQVGTRNSQNFDLLRELGKVDKPVLIKRAMSGTIDELLQSAEYVFSSGNEKLLLCERGIRTFEKAYRNTLDLNAVPLLKERTHLPVIVDPSHGIGVRRFVERMAMAAVAAGADGLLVEVHEKPEEALSDSFQTLSFAEFDRLAARCRKLHAALQD